MRENVVKEEDLYRLIKDENFLSLENSLNTFNIFNALALETAENRHSAFLAFLLDPRESHQSGALFLKEFLQEVFPSKATLFEKINLTNTTVYKEYKCSSRKKTRLDILLLDEENKSLYAIEHKIKAKEHKQKSSTQLQCYKKSLLNNPNTKKYDKQYYIFLTTHGDAPSDKGWIPISYNTIETVVQRILRSYEYKLLPPFKAILEQYLLTIKRNILMSDTELEQLAQTIYQNHRKALDYIKENISDDISFATRIVKSVFNNHSNWFEMNSDGLRHTFYSFKEFGSYKELSDPDSDSDARYKKSYLGFLIEKKDQRGIIIKYIIGPTKKNRSFRNKLQKYLMDHAYTKRKTKTESYHTIFSEILIPKKKIAELFENKQKESIIQKEIDELISKLYCDFEHKLKEAIEACQKKEK